MTSFGYMKMFEQEKPRQTHPYTFFSEDEKGDFNVAIQETRASYEAMRPILNDLDTNYVGW